MPHKLLTVWSKSPGTIVPNNNESVHLKEIEYSDAEYEAIRKDADLWCIKNVHEKGEDYGYSQRDSSIDISYHAVAEDIIVVKNGKFVGVAIKSSGKSFNKVMTVYNSFDVHFISEWKGKRGIYCGHSEDSFSSDDHERWDIYDFYLIKTEDKD